MSLGSTVQGTINAHYAGPGGASTGGTSGGSGTITSGTPTGSPPTGGGIGTISADRTTYLAWTSKGRRSNGRVRLETATVPTLIGDIQVTTEFENPVASASFQAADKRVSRFWPISWANGDKDVEIEFAVGATTGPVKRWIPFAGRTKGAPNEGPYRPRATFTCESYAGDYLGRSGCMRAPALQGKRRGFYFRKYLEACGIPLTNATSLDNQGHIVTRPVEWNGIMGIDLSKRVGELEGWNIRWSPKENAFEVISDQQMFTGQPVFHFHEGTYHALADEPPSQIPGIFVLSGSRLTAESLLDQPELDTKEHTEPGVDGNGLPTAVTTRTTTERGVIVLQEVEEYSTFQLDGVTPGPLDFQLRRKTVISSEYERAALVGTEAQGRLTTQLKKRTTRYYDGNSAIPMKTGASGGHVWASGGTYDSASARLLLIQEIVLEATWNTDLAGIANCTLASQKVTTKQYYSPLKKAAAGGVLYPDSTYRADDSYVWQIVEEVSQVWSDYRFLGNVEPEVIERSDYKRWIPTAIDSSTGQPTESYRSALYETRRWVGNASSTHWTCTVTTQANGVGVKGGQATGSDASKGLLLASDSSLEGDGPVPGPPMASPQVPQFQQRPMILSIDASAALPYQVERVTEMLEMAEDEGELLAVANRRLLLALCSTVTIQGPMLPFLREGDPVEVTNVARNIVQRRAFVAKIDRAMNVPNGLARQVTTVKVLPDFPVWQPLMQQAA